MFTGLVLDIGTVLDVEHVNDGMTFSVDTRLELSRLVLGSSVACNGVCLTVAREAQGIVGGRRSVGFFVGPVTLQKSSLGNLRAGCRLNLEPALRQGDPLGGHQVQGHVDGTAEVISFEWRGEARLLIIRVSRDWLNWLIPQGSIAIRGVSLTVADVDPSRALVTTMLIPHTLSATNLSELVPGDWVEVECDMQVKALARMAESLFPALFSRVQTPAAPPYGPEALLTDE